MSRLSRALGEQRLVGVDDLAAQELIADGQDLRLQGASSRSRASAAK